MEYGSIPGVIDSDLLEIVRDRLRSFQEGGFSMPRKRVRIDSHRGSTHVDESQGRGSN